MQKYKNGLQHGISKAYDEGKLIAKNKYKRGELIENSKEEEVQDSTQLEPILSTDTSTRNSEEESGRLKSLWKKWFGKNNEAKEEKSETKEEEDPTRKSRKRKKKNDDE